MWGNMKLKQNLEFDFLILRHTIFLKHIVKFAKSMVENQIFSM